MWRLMALLVLGGCAQPQAEHAASLMPPPAAVEQSQITVQAASVPAPIAQAEEKPRPTRPVRSPEDRDQADRRKLIGELIADGVFKSHKLNDQGDIVRLVVTPRFESLDFDQKNAFVGVVYAYYFGPAAVESKMVRVISSKTNKDLGLYSANAGGLTLD